MTADTAALRYYNAQRQARIEEEARKVAEINRNKGATDFLAHGPGVREKLQEVDTRKERLHPAEVSDAAGIMLQREADRAYKILEDNMQWSGFPVSRGSRQVGQPFPEFPHRKDTIVGIIDRGNGLKVAITMANFQAQEIEPQADGTLAYRGVPKPRDGVAERPTLAVYGIRQTAEGKFEVDPAFTKQGLAWKADNIQTVAKACYNAATRNAPAAQPGTRPELGRTPAEQRPDFAQLRAARQAQQQPRTTFGQRGQEMTR